ncbi:MAG TPA: PQQ-dependent sugar dehydrogenase [Gammaproteobacteria bacterium]
MMPSVSSIRLAAAAVLMIGASASAVAQRAQPTPIGEGPWDIATETGTVHVTVLTRELQSPWSLVFLPDGDMLLTERVGRLRVIRDGKLDPNPIEGLPALVNASIGGLMGLALHPDFEENRLIYFAYTKPHPDDEALTSLAVARARWDGGPSLADVEDVFVAKDWYSSAMAAENNRCCGQGPASGSYGARIAFDDENRLYITSGDRNWGEKAQDPQSHLGKIIRLNDDGSIPDDNPFVGMEGYLPELYTLGHRNPTGLRFDPATGALWSTEFGPRGGDELNLIEAGKNYGWMLITQGEHYDGAPKALGSKGIEGYVDPVTAWPPSGNPGNVIVYRGDLFPEWQGNVLVAAMSRPGALVRVILDDEGRFVREERMLTEIGQRMRDVAEAPDGRIFVLTEASPMASPGAILVLEPAK